MMRISLKTRIVCLQLCLTLASTLQAADKFVSFIREEGTLELVTSQQRSFSILCADEEHKGVLTAVHNLPMQNGREVRMGKMYVFLLVLLTSLHS